MFYRKTLFIIIYLFLSNCTTTTSVNNMLGANIINAYSNKGFALIYSEELYKKKIINKKINERSLVVFQKNLEPAYIVFENYEKILQWNRSLRFGLAVCTLKGKFENVL